MHFKYMACCYLEYLKTASSPLNTKIVLLEGRAPVFSSFAETDLKWDVKILDKPISSQPHSDSGV